MSAETLFDLDAPAEDQDQELDDLELRADDTAWTSCRHCQTLTTAAGIHNRGHAPGADVCARMRALEEATR